MMPYFKKYLKYLLVISALAALTMFVFFLSNIFGQPKVSIVQPEAPGGWKEVRERYTRAGTVPRFSIDNEAYIGYRTFEQLKKLLGC